MIVDDTGIKPSLSKLETIAIIPIHTNVKQPGSFLGLTGYLCNCVKDYSNIAASLTFRLRTMPMSPKRARKMSIECRGKHQMTFDLLKLRLAKPLMLVLPSWSDPFTLEIDAGVVGAGTILIQVIQNNKEVILAFVVYRLSKTHPNRGPTERESMTVLCAVAHFCQYLEGGRRFTLVTGCSALTYWLFRSRD